MAGLEYIFLEHISVRSNDLLHQKFKAIEEEKERVTSFPHLVSSLQYIGGNVGTWICAPCKIINFNNHFRQRTFPMKKILIQLIYIVFQGIEPRVHDLKMFFPCTVLSLYSTDTEGWASKCNAPLCERLH